MISIDPKQNSERDNYKLLIGSIIPRPIAFVTTQSEDEIVNGAPFSYFNIVSSNPPMVSLAIQRPGGRVKDTARNIYGNQQFVVHIVDDENVAKINETAASLPAAVSEIELANLTLVPSEYISVPGVKEAKVRMECRLIQAIPLGGEEPGSDLFIGEVVRFHIDEAIYENGRIDPKGLNAISRLAGSSYATIGDIFSIERPK
ncbi:flavin reductase family protein [Psychrobacillus psychrodurans]|uniref:flavin reductase family protein n=1 Tax=Psychrobacillus TaxID=1221880 RepID=UPI0008E1AE66|nr:flavin reductase family protein [Psychrobacillus psychrodurans]MCK1996934.1 flavin reductase family protein [Psychrobacillus psychrodurans]MCZ8538737.1 flavin reductase family protein [Psychrobacillus psychrodurans]SFM20888.1 NADH-FMN oxidoreductase RutF, flavin reductase (DIM6/NTAB) family [Psychrobacillus psychrodurans]